MPIYWMSFMLLAASSIGQEKFLEKTLLQSFFPELQDEIQIEELKGGLSGTSLYKVKADGHEYVLRINRNALLLDQDRLELEALLKAEKMGLAPSIVAVSSDERAVLMEYIDLPTLTLEQSKKMESAAKIATAARKAHSMEVCRIKGESLLSKAERCYAVIADFDWVPHRQIQAAMELIKQRTQELAVHSSAAVQVHGDLNPRNIFLLSDKILFIDWAETCVEDPFYDLSYFALKVDYSPDEEMLLLSSYLQREPTVEEGGRYCIYKKMHQAFWSLTNLYLAGVELKKHPEQSIDIDTQLKSWNYYQKAFSDNLEPLSAQYFYELSRVNYQLAH